MERACFRVNILHHACTVQVRVRVKNVARTSVNAHAGVKTAQFLFFFPGGPKLDVSCQTSLPFLINTFCTLQQ